MRVSTEFKSNLCGQERAAIAIGELLPGQVPWVQSLVRTGCFRGNTRALVRAGRARSRTSLTEARHEAQMRLN